MPREKMGYRDTIAELNRLFPEKGMLTRAEVCKFTGRSDSTVRRKFTFNQDGLLTKADLARQVCI